ncbi:MAG: hypothetical protein C6I01_01620 [Epsilonproteobacteria bacterium]|nr:hypothetical protein [Campylobacterota bacterium]NPA89322.1 ComF family protein [Campylobacterota bacterium]
MGFFKVLKGEKEGHLYPSCLLCGNMSFGGICRRCLRGVEELAEPQIDKKLNLLYFFQYKDIEPIIKAKYHPFGNRVLEKIAPVVFGKIAKNPFPFPVVGIPIDPVPYRGFSHTAILARHLPFPLTYGLKAKERVQYSGKDMEFRLKNLRKFTYSGPRGIRGVLIDDLVTTGLTLKVASQFLEKFQVEIVGSIALARG